MPTTNLEGSEIALPHIDNLLELATAPLGSRSLKHQLNRLSTPTHNRTLLVDIAVSPFLALRIVKSGQETQRQA
jgi:hypothetical protein